MKRLYRVYVEMEDSAEMYVEAESPEDAATTAEAAFEAKEWWPDGASEIIFNDPSQLNDAAQLPWSKVFPVHGVSEDMTVEQWWEEHDKRSREQGTPEYRAALEASGQKILL